MTLPSSQPCEKKYRYKPEMTEISIGPPDIFRYCQLTGQIVKD